MVRIAHLRKVPPAGRDRPRVRRCRLLVAIFLRRVASLTSQMYFGICFCAQKFWRDNARMGPLCRRLFPALGQAERGDRRPSIAQEGFLAASQTRGGLSFPEGGMLRSARAAGLRLLLCWRYSTKDADLKGQLPRSIHASRKCVLFMSSVGVGDQSRGKSGKH